MHVKVLKLALMTKIAGEIIPEPFESLPKFGGNLDFGTHTNTTPQKNYNIGLRSLADMAIQHF